MSKKSAALAVISHYIQTDPARAAGALERANAATYETALQLAMEVAARGED
ncbi:MAG: hypothetical protein RQ748_10280 [Elusimicrobiales bacterium]|nr:hypothetical protein [Elusimicrobiales bacterium]